MIVSIASRKKVKRQKTMKNTIAKAFILLSFLLIFSFNTKGDKLENGFDRLKMFDYFNAKEYFEKSLESKAPGAAYGLSIIFSSDKNPFYNLDSARKYILISDSTFSSLKEKEKKYYSKLGVNDSSINNQTEIICNSEFEVVQKADSLEAYEHFLNNFFSCKEKSKVVALRNTAAFRIATKENTSSSYDHFVKTYPTAEEASRATDMYEQRLFDEKTVDHDIASYALFMSEHPESPYKAEAERLIYKLSTIHQTIGEFSSYARNNSKTPFTGEAWRQVYAQSMKDFSEETFRKFKSSFPDYPFVNELESDYKLQNYIFLPVSKNEKWGYINELGQEMIPAQFDEASLFSDGLAVVVKNNKSGYINKAGKTVLSFIYDDAENFRNGSAVIMKDSLYGLINRIGEILINPEYEELGDPVDGICVGVKKGKYGFIAKNGKVLTQFVYDLATDFKEGFAIVSLDDKYGIINSLGKYVVEPTYEDVIPIGSNRLKVANDELWGIIDYHGKIIQPLIYDAIGDYGNGLALVAHAGKYGYVNDTGALRIPIKYLYSSVVLNTGKFEKGYVLLKIKGKQILSDSSGMIISFPGIENYGLPSEGFFPVMKNKKWGYSDFSGKIKIGNKFEDAGTFQNGVALVRSKGLYGMIDTTGSFIISPIYDKLIIQDNFIVVLKEGKKGMLTKDASLILPCAYNNIDLIGNKIFRGVNDARLVYVDTKGRIIYVGDIE